MGKTGNRIRILLCCLLLSCLTLSGCWSRFRYDGNDRRNQYYRYSYFVYNINGGNSGKCEDYFYYTCSDGIAQFSMADQDITKCMISDADFDAYAVCDLYIFFVTKGETIQDPYKVWKYNRATESCELFFETARGSCDRIYVYKDLLIYGNMYGLDVCVCPIEGSPETDTVSLKKLFEEQNLQGQQAQKKSFQVRRESYQVQEISYRGLRILFYGKDSSESYRIFGILEENGGNAIWDTSLGGSRDGVFWTEGEWIVFTKDPEGYFYYQREGETEMNTIHCLDELQYEYSAVNPNCVVREGECVVGAISVSRDQFISYFLDQDDIQNDLLFEINLETGTSRIIYETDSAQTRIIGYKNGRVYLLEDDVIYRGWTDKTEREKVYDLQEDGWKAYHGSGRHKNVSFRWQGDNLIIQGEMMDDIRSICISD